MFCVFLFFKLIPHPIVTYVTNIRSMECNIYCDVAAESLNDLIRQIVHCQTTAR
jgi:hypothetical protein